MDGQNYQGQKTGGSRVDIVGWLQESWQIFKSAWQIYVLSALVFLAVTLLAQIVPFGGFVVTGPMVVGFYMVVGDHLSGRGYNLGRLFGGFSLFVPAFLANLLITIFTLMGLVMLIIPGLIIGSWYLFTYLYILDRGMEFWPAMEASRKLAFDDIVGFALFFLIIGILNFLGVILLFVGMLVSLPVTFIAIFVAYRQLVGVKTLVTEGGTPGNGTVTTA